MGTNRRVVVWMLPLLIAGLLSLSQPTVADSGYIVDTELGEELEHTNNSKQWYAHGTWWAILQDESPDDWFLYRNDRATPALVGEQGGWSKQATNVDSRNSQIDVFHIPSTDVVHVLRKHSSGDVYREFVWSAADDRYVQDTSLGDVSLPDISEDGCIAVDSTGQAFIAWESGGVVSLAFTTSATRSAWSTITIDSGTPVDRDNRPALIPFLDPTDGPQMGLLYFSGPQTLTFRAHDDDDGDTPGSWSTETVDTNASADDHACLRSYDSSGDVFAVVKTFDNELLFFKRLPGGSWGDRTTIASDPFNTRGQIVVDETNEDVYVFWSDLTGTGRIVYRSSAINPIAFGDIFEAISQPGEDLNDVQLAKAGVDCETDLLALAHGSMSNWYNLLDLDTGDPIWYRDEDGDGFGDPNNGRAACRRPEGYLENAGDCDDTTALVYPGAPEVCDHKKNDCADPNWPQIDDADRDTIEDSCDNCLLEFNASQSDLDGDGEGDRCDADDGLIYAFFLEVDLFEWHPESGFEAWNAYRGDLDVLRDTGQYTQAPGSNALARQDCGLTSPSVPDPDAPALGSASHFLVTGISGGVEGDLGVDGSGNPRPNDHPCP